MAQTHSFLWTTARVQDEVPPLLFELHLRERESGLCCLLLLQEQTIYFFSCLNELGILHLREDWELWGKERAQSGPLFLPIHSLKIPKSTIKKNEEVSEGVGRFDHLLSRGYYRISIVWQRGRDSHRGANSQGYRRPRDAGVGKLSAV